MEIFKQINAIAQEAYDKESAHQAQINPHKSQEKRFHFQQVEIEVGKLLAPEVVQEHRALLERALLHRMAHFMNYLKSINQVLMQSGVYYKDVNEQVLTVVQMSIEGFKKTTAKKEPDGKDDGKPA